MRLRKEVMKMKFKQRNNYEQLASLKISKSRQIIVSSVPGKGFTIAQQLFVEEAGRNTTVFLKGAIHIESVESLKELRDALNVAIHKAEEDADNWDK